MPAKTNLNQWPVYSLVARDFAWPGDGSDFPVLFLNLDRFLPKFSPGPKEQVREHSERVLSSNGENILTQQSPHIGVVVTRKRLLRQDADKFFQATGYML